MIHSFPMRVILAGIFIFVNIAPIVAQETPDHNALLRKRSISQIEIFAGPSVSNFWGNHTIHDQVINVRHAVGAGIVHPVNTSFDLNAKLFWELKGNKADYETVLFDENNEPFTTRFVQGNRLEYITAAIILKYYLITGRKFFAGFGLSASKLLKEDTYTKQYDLNGTQISYYKSKTNAYSDFDGGCLINVGFNHPLSSKYIFSTQLMGNLGVINIDKQPNSAGAFRNYSVTLLLGITLNK